MKQRSTLSIELIAKMMPMPNYPFENVSSSSFSSTSSSGWTLGPNHASDIQKQLIRSLSPTPRERMSEDFKMFLSTTHYRNSSFVTCFGH